MAILASNSAVPRLPVQPPVAPAAEGVQLCPVQLPLSPCCHQQLHDCCWRRSSRLPSTWRPPPRACAARLCGPAPACTLPARSAARIWRIRSGLSVQPSRPCRCQARRRRWRLEQPGACYSRRSGATEVMSFDCLCVKVLRPQPQPGGISKGGALPLLAQWVGARCAAGHRCAPF